MTQRVVQERVPEYPRCPYCKPHEFHGLPCKVGVILLQANLNRCTCVSSVKEVHDRGSEQT